MAERRVRVADAPVTWTVVAASIGLFVAEVAVGARTGAPPSAVAAALFVDHPWLAWALAPALHHGVAHLAGNVAVLAVAAPVERRLSARQTLALLLLAGFLPLYAEGAKLAALAADPHVGAYGASGYAFGILGCGLVLGGPNTPRWWLVRLGGVAAALVVAFDLLTSFGAPLAVNVGHLGGLLAGSAVGAFAD